MGWGHLPNAASSLTTLVRKIPLTPGRPTPIPSSPGGEILGPCTPHSSQPTPVPGPSQLTRRGGRYSTPLLSSALPSLPGGEILNPTPHSGQPTPVLGPSQLTRRGDTQPHPSLRSAHSCPWPFPAHQEGRYSAPPLTPASPLLSPALPSSPGGEILSPTPHSSQPTPVLGPSQLTRRGDTQPHPSLQPAHSCPRPFPAYQEGRYSAPPLTPASPLLSPALTSLPGGEILGPTPHSGQPTPILGPSLPAHQEGRYSAPPLTPVSQLLSSALPYQLTRKGDTRPHPSLWLAQEGRYSSAPPLTPASPLLLLEVPTHQEGRESPVRKSGNL